MGKTKSIRRTGAVILIGILTAAFSISTKAQDKTHFESWNSFRIEKYLRKARFMFSNDFGFRPSFDEEFNITYLLRPKAIIDLGDIIDFYPSVDFRFGQYPNYTNTIEIRFWQGLKLHWPDIGRVEFSHFYRLEERLHWTEGFERDEVSLRSRYRLNMRIPLNNPYITDKTYFMDLRAEAFLPHTETFEELYASTLRLGIRGAYNVNRKWRYNLTAYLDRGKNTIDDDRTSSRFMLEFLVRMRL